MAVLNQVLLSYALMGALSVTSSTCIVISRSFAWLLNIISQELDSKAMNRTIRTSSFKALKEESAIISKRKSKIIREEGMAFLSPLVKNPYLSPLYFLSLEFDSSLNYEMHLCLSLQSEVGNHNGRRYYGMQ